MKTSKPFLTLAAGCAIAAAATPSANAAVILADDFTGVTKSGNIASFTAWDTVNGIDAPGSSLSFTDPGNSDAALAFFNVTANEIDVNENIGNGGQWATSFILDLSTETTSIDLTSLDISVRLANGSGGDNTTGSKDGIYTVQIQGSLSGDLGSASSPTISYGSVSDNDVSIDLTAFANLDQTETYTVTLSVARNTQVFGHHISLQDLSLSGEIVPEPGSLALLGLGGLLIASRRRRG